MTWISLRTLAMALSLASCRVATLFLLCWPVWFRMLVLVVVLVNVATENFARVFCRVSCRSYLTVRFLFWCCCCSRVCRFLARPLATGRIQKMPVQRRASFLSVARASCRDKRELRHTCRCSSSPFDHPVILERRTSFRPFWGFSEDYLNLFYTATWKHEPMSIWTYRNIVWEMVGERRWPLVLVSSQGGWIRMVSWLSRCSLLHCICVALWLGSSSTNRQTREELLRVGKL